MSAIFTDSAILRTAAYDADDLRARRETHERYSERGCCARPSGAGWCGPRGSYSVEKDEGELRRIVLSSPPADTPTIYP
jgi:hypothetical protein